MKKFRAIVPPEPPTIGLLLAIIFAFAQSFTTLDSSKASTVGNMSAFGNKWYKFDGGSTHSGENSVSSYTYLDSQDPDSESCEGDEYVCLILAPEGTFPRPDLPNMTDVFTDTRIEQLVPKD